MTSGNARVSSDGQSVDGLEKQIAVHSRVEGERLPSIVKLSNTPSRRLPIGDEAGRRRIDPQTERAVRAFLLRLQGRHAPIDVLVFGSRARGTHRPDSDADLAVIFEDKHCDRASIGLDMAGIAVDVLDETGILVSPLPLWAVELERPELYRNPALIEAIRRDGLRL
jgi:predicted nucleotidyltransferase